MFGDKRYGEINSILNARFAAKKVLIAQHRGGRGGNVPENTLLAFRTALLSGADMFEMDVSRSTDGKLYCFHDTAEQFNLRQHKNIQAFSSRAIAEMELYNSIGEPSGFGVQDMEQVIEYFRNGELYNVDRSWDKLVETFALLNKHPHSIKQALLKAPARKDILDKYADEPTKFMFMPIVYDVSEIELVKSYKEINTVGVELIVRSEGDKLFTTDLIAELHAAGYFVWINAITLSALDSHVLSGGFDDNASLEFGFDRGWGVLIDKGVDILQTDWPSLLCAYRNKRLNVN